MFIARINKVARPELSVGEIRGLKKRYEAVLAAQEKRKVLGFGDLFRYPSIRLVTRSTAVLAVTIMSLFFCPVLLIDRFDLGIYINGWMVGAAELVAYPLCYYLISRTARKLVVIRGLAITCACSLALLFLWDQDERQVS